MHRIHGCQKKSSTLKSEKELGEKFWHFVEEAEKSGFDAESALRRFCLEKEKEIF